eukprot:1803046-Rhodomonas_salina.5
MVEGDAPALTSEGAGLVVGQGVAVVVVLVVTAGVGGRTGLFTSLYQGTPAEAFPARLMQLPPVPETLTAGKKSRDRAPKHCNVTAKGVAAPDPSNRGAGWEGSDADACTKHRDPGSSLPAAAMIV